MVQKIFSAIVVSVTVFLSGCASHAFDPADAYESMSAADIYHAGEKALKDEYFSDAIQYYQTYDARYPFGDDIEQAQLSIIYAYYMKGENAEAMAAAERFIHLHPTSAHVDYAYYMLGRANFLSNIVNLDRYLPIDFATRDLTNAKRAFLQFGELVHRFPKSKYVPDAKQHMVFLRNILADHEFEVAVFYYKRNAFAASANRANQVIRHFQGAPVVPKAMVVMIKSYHKLGLDDLALEATKVLEANVSTIPEVPEIS